MLASDNCYCCRWLSNNLRVSELRRKFDRPAARFYYPQCRKTSVKLCEFIIWVSDLWTFNFQDL